jgi:hypothetical protein
MTELKKLLKENTGLLSRMKERDGNDQLNKICEELFKKELECSKRCNACPYTLECDKDEFYWDDYAYED